MSDRSDEEAKRAARATWGACPAGMTFGAGAEPGSKEFFERVLDTRNTYELPWLKEVIPFPTFAGRRVLEIGCGAGYDAFELMRNGAVYTGVDLAPENCERVIRHLGYFGFRPNVRVADAEALPFEAESFDDVFSNGVLHHTPDLDLAISEAFRVLRPGGRFFLIVYNRDSVFHWITLFLADQVVKGGFRKRTLAERRSMIEYTTATERPLVNVYSRGQLKRHLRAAGFDVVRICVRKLVAEDLPSLPLVRSLWRRIPQRVLDSIGRLFGWYVIAEARKPGREP